MPGSDVESFFDIERMDYVEQEGEPGKVATEVERKPVVISLGGSLFYEDDEDGAAVLAIDYLKDAAEWLKGISRSFKVFVVVGGGRAAKEMIVELRDEGVSESALDTLGIDMTRVNARVLRCIMDLPGLRVPEDFDRALAESAYNKTVIMGGTHPGHTTDAVAAMLAEIVGAAVLVIATDVDGIFNADPNEVPDARLFDELSPSDVCILSSGYDVGAGSKAPIDPMAARIIARSGIRTVILNGADLDNLEAAIRGSDFTGTSIEVEVESTLDGSDAADIADAKRKEIEKKAKKKGKGRSEDDKAEGKRLLLKSFSKDGKKPKKKKRKRKDPEEETAEESPEEEPEAVEGHEQEEVEEKEPEEEPEDEEPGEPEQVEEKEPEEEPKDEAPDPEVSEGGEEAPDPEEPEGGEKAPEPEPDEEPAEEETPEEGGTEDEDGPEPVGDRAEDDAEIEWSTSEDKADGPKRSSDQDWDLPSLDDVEV